MSSKLKKVLHDQIDFNSYLREKKILVSLVDQEDLSDICFTFHTSPSVQPLLPDQGMISPDDIRLYINNQNYTQQLIDELKQLLSDEDAATVKKQYLNGGTRWLKYQQTLNVDGIDVEAERAKLTNFANGRLTDQLGKLGDRKYGRGGNLQLINFLYSYIKLEPISINNLIKRKYGANGKVSNVKDLYPIQIIFSSGPAPSVEDFAANAPLRGMLSYVIDFIYDNPLFDLMQQINKQGTQIQKQLEDQRTNYFDPIINDLQTLENDTKLKLGELKNSIAEVDKEVRAAKGSTN